MPEERVAAVLRGGREARPGKKGAAPYTGQPGRTRACGTAAGAAGPAEFRPRGRNVRPRPGCMRKPRISASHPSGEARFRVWGFGTRPLPASGRKKSAPEGALGNADHWASVSIFRWSSSSCFSVT